MRNIIKFLNILLILSFLSIQNISSEEKTIIEKDHEWNFYSGMFDFSDYGKRA